MQRISPRGTPATEGRTDESNEWMGQMEELARRGAFYRREVPS